ncbi:STAS domain-containing protein [Streptomyces sp. NPDC093094]|uniref:STAS domain-containing protein n=1 Tax=Streptomyces sp. NPDC093094 TaxID=3366026 RepID=UPI003822DD6B
MPWDGTATPAPTSDTGTTRLPQTAGHGPQEARVRQYERHGAGVIAAHGAWDMDSIKPLADALDTAAGKYPKIVLDASEITFADSSFLNLLVRIHRTAALRLVAPSLQVQRLCEITGMDSLLAVHGTVDDAAAA